MRFLLNLCLAMKQNKVKRLVFWPFWHFRSQFDTNRSCTYTREICTSPIFKTKSRESGWSSYLTFQIETRRLWLLSLKFSSDQTGGKTFLPKWRFSPRHFSLRRFSPKIISPHFFQKFAQVRRFSPKDVSPRDISPHFPIFMRLPLKLEIHWVRLVCFSWG